MRTKQAQLKAKKKEMLAQQAMIRAELKEKEAAVCLYMHLFLKNPSIGCVFLGTDHVQIND